MQTTILTLLLVITSAGVSAIGKLNSSTTTILTATTITTRPSSTATIQQVSVSCTYCKTRVCRCSSTAAILNCSSYLLNLTFASDCAQTIIWETVDFSSRNYESFDSVRLLSLRTRRLILKSNLIVKIADNTFDPLGDILIELDLQTNQLANVSSKWLSSKLFQLTKLNLASNQLESLADLDNVHLPRFQELNLSRNQIDIFPNEIQQWTSLVTLDLSYNTLSAIPRYAMRGLNNLTWLSLSSNRYLTCIIQDSFKYLKSLTFLDLSSTNLHNLDACIFIQLTDLRTLTIERVLFNCSSCWLSVAKEHAIQISGQCLDNVTLHRLDSLTNAQLHHVCSKSSIDCSSDYCEPGTARIGHDNSPVGKLSKNLNNSSDTNALSNRTVGIILGIVFSMVAVVTLIIVGILFYRWRQGKKLFCCNFISTASPSAIAEAARRRHKKIVNNNPAVIESVVTHGANMNVPPYSHQNYSYLDENTSNHKRKLFNPMFTDSSTTTTTAHAETKHQHQVAMVSNDNSHGHLYSENL